MSVFDWATFAKRLRFAVCAALVVLAGCKEDAGVLTVGSKDFTENQILAELMAQMAEAEGVPVQRRIPFGTAAMTFEALKQSRLDVYPEYNGTGLVYLGQSPLTDGDAATERVQALYEPLGLEWRERMGFSSDYVLVMRPEDASSRGITKISDLAELDAVDFAVDATFRERPLDGLFAMSRRYGIEVGEVRAFKIAEGGKDKIVEALLDGEALVAELFRTDQQIDAFDLVVIEDDLGFFPVYEPSPLVRKEALETFPAAAAAFAKLENAVSAAEMRQMITAIEVDNQNLGAVVIDFLSDKGLREATAAVSTVVQAEPLVVGFSPLDKLSGDAGKALRATRLVFPQRAIEVLRSPNPVGAVTRGEARLGVAGIDAFFTTEGDRAQLASSAEALGVIGYQTAHVITRRGGASELAGVSKLGVGSAGAASDRVAGFVLAGLGLDAVDVVREGDDIEAQFAAMSRGLVDAIFVMAPVGDASVLEQFDAAQHQLVSLGAWNAGNAPLRFSFLRPTRIPADTYAGQSAPVETLSVQQVLVGPSGTREAFGAQGPATTGSAATQPLPAATVKSLFEALGGGEQVDPAAPMAAALRPELEPPPEPLVADVTTSVINIATVVFLIWLVYLLGAGPVRRERARESDLRIRPARSETS